MNADFHAEGLNIRTNVDCDEQESSFQNATLQTVGENIAVSIATYIDVPADIADDPVRVEMYIRGVLLTSIHATNKVLSYDVEMGPDER